MSPTCSKTDFDSLSLPSYQSDTLSIIQTLLLHNHPQLLGPLNGDQYYPIQQTEHLPDASTKGQPFCTSN